MMKTKPALHALAASLACAACAAVVAADYAAKAAAFSKAYGTTRLCTDVEACATGSPIVVTVGANCAISVNPWTVGVPSGLHNVKLRWNISGNAEFNPKDGIFFKSNGGEFDQSNALGKTSWMANDKNPAATPRPRPIGYGINVLQNGKACPTLDPTVVNDF